jgi:hypothetical protein
MIKSKPRKCKVCQTVFTPTQFLQATCNYKCAIDYSKTLKENKVKADWKIKKAVLKDKLKTLGQYEMDAKKSFQKWVRIRDKDQNCISCNGKDKEYFDGGHFFKAELFSGLIFNEKNCHKQCRKCNRFLNGNELQYRFGLINRYGLEYVTEIESISSANRVYKYTKDELIEIKKIYDLKIKELTKKQKL